MCRVHHVLVLQLSLALHIMSVTGALTSSLFLSWKKRNVVEVTEIMQIIAFVASRIKFSLGAYIEHNLKIPAANSLVLSLSQISR